jgi:hypothetical protein
MIDSGYKHSHLARKILVAMAPIVCPAEIVEQDLVHATIDSLQDFMSSCTGEVVKATALGLYAFEFTSCLHPAHNGRTFTQLPPDKALAWFELWWHSPLVPMREFAKKTKGLVAMAYYEQPAMAAQLDYHPEKWIRLVAKRRLDSYGDEIRKKEAENTMSDPLMAALEAHR